MRSLKPQTFFYLLPLIIIALTRIAIEFLVQVINVHYAWLAAFAVYYLLIVIAYRFALRMNYLTGNDLSVKTKSKNFIPIIWGIILPALMPITLFLKNVSSLSLEMITSILIFALINPYFEEKFWRKLMGNLPVSNFLKIFYSAFWFSAGHYLMWASYWLVEPKIWITTVVVTFIMGLLWMSFYVKTGKYNYIYYSHLVVDILNLSAIIFLGLPIKTI